jgi:hypothetical protein
MQLTGRTTAQVADNKGVFGIVFAAVVVVAIVTALAFQTVGLARPALGGVHAPAAVTQALPGSNRWIAPDGDGRPRSITNGGSAVWITPDWADRYQPASTDRSARRMIAE